MIVSDNVAIDASYRVEVSGWDDAESFFVEKSQLAGDELMGKRIALLHNLEDGAIVFVRVILPNTYHRACPVAYQTEFTGFDPDGFYLFRLSPASPKHSASRYPVN